MSLEAVCHSAFGDGSYLHIIRRTADGKSMVPLTVGALRRRVIIVLVPLIGLGSDQVSKAISIKHNTEAYHINEHKGDDALYFRAAFVTNH